MKNIKFDEENTKKEIKKVLKNIKSEYANKNKQTLNNPRKLEELINNSTNLLNSKNLNYLIKIVSKIKIMISMVKDWKNNVYRKTPKKVMISIVFCLLYFINPVDLIPDWLIVIGFFDDALIITWVLKEINDEIKMYEEFKNNNKLQ